LSVSLVDFDFAPIFVRSHHIGLEAMLFKNDAYASVKRWSDSVCSIQAVEATLGDDFARQLQTSVRTSGVYAAKQLGL
jgi:hypothetical protein